MPHGLTVTSVYLSKFHIHGSASAGRYFFHEVSLLFVFCGKAKIEFIIFIL